MMLKPGLPGACDLFELEVQSCALVFTCFHSNKLLVHWEKEQAKNTPDFLSKHMCVYIYYIQSFNTYYVQGTLLGIMLKLNDEQLTKNLKAPTLE